MQGRICYICKNCGHPFFPRKRSRKHYCRYCGGSKFHKWKAQDIKIFWNYFKEESIDIETMELATQLQRILPKKPAEAPGCWGTYQRRTHCRVICKEARGDIRESCRKRTRFDDQFKAWMDKVKKL